MKKIVVGLLLTIITPFSFGQASLFKDVNVGSGSSFPEKFTVVGSEFFFEADDGINGLELWKSDGTVAGTVLVKDINPTGSSGLVVVTTFNNELYFTTDDGVNGLELWKSDGTATGTVMVKDINPTGSSTPRSLAVFNGELYFQATDGVNGIELWKTDGTAAGTIMIELEPGPFSSIPAGMIEMNNELFFTASISLDGAGTELYKSDGTVAGTVLVKDIRPGNINSTAAGFTIFNNELYFRANDGVNGIELWKTDGTTAGTVLVKDVNPTGSSLIAQLNLIPLNNELYFQASDGVNGVEYWKTDGTAAGTVMIKDINPGANSSTPFRPITYANHVFFQADDGINGKELWKTDGTTTGTVLVKDINPSGDAHPSNFTVFNNELFFKSDDGTNGQELWKTDGTNSGTLLVQDINLNVGAGSAPTNLTSFNNELFFRATDWISGMEIWKYCPLTTSSYSVTECLSYTVPSGDETYTTVGTYTVMDTIANSASCDSIMTINVTILPALTGTITNTICNDDSIVVNGTTYNAGNPTGTEIFTNIGPNNCDSTVTVSLNVLPALTGTVNTTICNNGSVTVNGTVYNAGNPTGTEIFTNVGPNNCDSTVTVSLNVLPALTGTVNNTICNNDSVVVNGTVYNAGNPTGTEIFTNVGPNNCDSTVTVSLNVLAAIDITVNNTSPTLTSNENGASYQWLDCDNNFAVIPTATNQSYTATANGNYAVEITVGSCVDTSACENVSGVGINENSFGANFKIYPNPTKDVINIILGNNSTSVNYVITTIEGKVILNGNTADHKIVVDLASESNGIYFLLLRAESTTTSYKIVKH